MSFGIAVAQRGLWEEARYRFERAVAIDARYAEAYNNLAIAYEQLGLVEKQLYEEIHARARSEARR